MKIIIGQGNPGANYTHSRHNIGFMALNYFAEQNQIQFAQKTKFFSYIAELNVSSEKILLVKPSTFYNRTGQTARALADFYKLTPEDFLIVHDDLALPFGSIRVRQGGGSAGNNGVRSISSQLGKDTWRLRIGVTNDLRAQADDANFVLGKFNAKEQETLKNELLPQACQVINQFIEGGINPTTHQSSAD